MKKLCLVLGLAGLLSMPSIVFGEATWYGSFRGGVESAGGSSHMFSNGSRWGVKGSNEISEGLTANYRYEEALDLATASLATGNRLSYVGLSGGFGTISIGRIWSASFNSVGAILDNSWVYGSSHTSYRVGPAVSYSNSAGAASLQVDLVMDGDNAAKSGVDSYEFGLSFDLGAATLAFAHRKRNIAATSVTTTEFNAGTPATAPTITITPGTDGTGATAPTITVTPGMDGTGATAPTVTMTPGTDGTAATAPTVRVIPAVEAVEAKDAVPAITELASTASATPAAADRKRAVIPTGVRPLEGVAEGACTTDDVIWIATADVSNTVTTGCYVKASGVSIEDNRLKSAKSGTADVTPLAATGHNQNVHYNAAQCAAAFDPDTLEADAPTAAAGVWEPNSKMCYPAGTLFSYVTREAKAAVPAVEAVEAQPARIEVDVPGKDGTAATAPTVTITPGTDGEGATAPTVTVTPGTDGEGATAPTVTVTPGTDGTPPSMMEVTTTTPGYDDTMNAVAVRFAAGSHSAAVGLVKTSDSRGMESSTTIANAGGPLSDGLSYNFMVRDTEGTGSNPWLIGLAKSLGGGSTVVLEHADNGDNNSTAVYLQVDF